MPLYTEDSSFFFFFLYNQNTYIVAEMGAKFKRATWQKAQDVCTTNDVKICCLVIFNAKCSVEFSDGLHVAPAERLRNVYHQQTNKKKNVRLKYSGKKWLLSKELFGERRTSPAH